VWLTAPGYANGSCMEHGVDLTSWMNTNDQPNLDDPMLWVGGSDPSSFPSSLSMPVCSDATEPEMAVLSITDGFPSKNIGTVSGRGKAGFFPDCVVCLFLSLLLCRFIVSPKGYSLFAVLPGWHGRRSDSSEFKRYGGPSDFSEKRFVCR
jgi:hypothetical protein